MEDRVARLEVHTEHIRENIARVETKIDKVESKIDNKIEPRLDALTETVAKVREEMKEGFAALRLEIANLHKGRWADKVWWLLIGGALLGVMARGFEWI